MNRSLKRKSTGDLSGPSDLSTRRSTGYPSALSDDQGNYMVYLANKGYLPVEDMLTLGSLNTKFDHLHKNPDFWYNYFKRLKSGSLH
jgi:hypothetical protein